MTYKPGFDRRLESFSKTYSTPAIRSRPIAGLTVHSRGADRSHEISNNKGNRAIDGESFPRLLYREAPSWRSFLSDRFFLGKKLNRWAISNGCYSSSMSCQTKR